MGMGSNTSAIAWARPGAQSGQEGFSSPFPPLPPVSLPRQVLCNFLSRFPLYGVATGLVNLTQRKELNVKQDDRSSEQEGTETTGKESLDLCSLRCLLFKSDLTLYAPAI